MVSTFLLSFSTVLLVNQQRIFWNVLARELCSHLSVSSIVESLRTAVGMVLTMWVLLWVLTIPTPVGMVSCENVDVGQLVNSKLHSPGIPGERPFTADLPLHWLSAFTQCWTISTAWVDHIRSLESSAPILNSTPAVHTLNSLDHSSSSGCCLWMCLLCTTLLTD